MDIDHLTIVVTATSGVGPLGATLDGLEARLATSVLHLDLAVAPGDGPEAADIPGLRRAAEAHGARIAGTDLRAALEGKTWDWVLVLPGDARHEPADVPDLGVLAPRYDLIAGFRAPRRDSRLGRSLGFLSAALWRLVVGGREPLRDPRAGVVLVRRELLDATLARCRLLPPGWLPAGSAVRAAASGFRVTQAPIHHAASGSASSSQGQMAEAPTFALVVALLRLRRELRASTTSQGESR